MLRIFAIILMVFALGFYVYKHQEMKLKEGDKAPGFSLQDSNGKSFSLASYKGKSPVIVYFYPKAGTSGCTKEACGIRDNWSKFSENGIPVLGISSDDKKDIKKFVDDYKLNFPLLSDNDKTVSKKYGVVGISGYDRRITFIIDKNSKIAHIVEVKDIDNHASMILEKAMALK
jgi:peroxiredoxin Q/BCP